MNILNRLVISLVVLVAMLVLSRPAAAQHLIWNLDGQKDATCVYGEITVLATSPGIYYCGANWHPGEPAGGYCGIQHNSATERRTIFSIWDTTPQLHPAVTEADKRTLTNRFGGEGTGAHTHMVWPWELGETFQFFVQKSPGAKPDTIDARYYVFDRKESKWRHSATITCPSGGKKSVATIGGYLNSFLENFLGKEKDAPKLALYKLWLGSSPDKMKRLVRSGGDGKWGQLGDAFFLAEGSDDRLKEVFAAAEKKYGKPAFGGKDAKLPPLADKPIDEKTLAALKSLPKAPVFSQGEGSGAGK